MESDVCLQSATSPLSDPVKAISENPASQSTGLSVTGGVRLGWFNASAPLASLSVSAAEIVLRVRFIDEYRFAPSAVVAFEPIGRLSFARGIRIRHAVADYPEKIIFWSQEPPRALIERIRQVGFQPSARVEDVPARDGFPVRWTVIVGATAVWGILFALDHAPADTSQARPPGPYAISALGLLCTACIAMLKSDRIRRLVLKPGRAFGEVRHWCRFLSFLAGFLAVVFTIVALSMPRR